MDYEKYRFGRIGILRYLLAYIGAAVLVSYTFYDSFYVLPLFIPLAPVYIKAVRNELKRRRKEQLKRQFRDMIDSVSTAMQAGYSAENAFHEAYKDMLRLYGHGSLIALELESFFTRLETGVVLEHVLKDFALRAKTEDITDFADIFSIAKRNGGNLTNIISNTVRIMKEKEETEKEIRVILSGRKFEQKIMCLIPLGIILYLKVSSGDLIGILYHNAAGAVIMTACLALLGISFYISRSLTDIRV